MRGWPKRASEPTLLREASRNREYSLLRAVRQRSRRISIAWAQRDLFTGGLEQALGSRKHLEELGTGQGVEDLPSLHSSID